MTRMKKMTRTMRYASEAAGIYEQAALSDFAASVLLYTLTCTVAIDIQLYIAG